VNAKQPGSKGKPKPKRVYVHELRKKLEFLYIRRKSNKADLCRKTGISPNSLDRALKKEDQLEGIEAGDEALGLDHQELIGKLYGFQAVDVFEGDLLIVQAWPEWQANSDASDPSSGVEREDTAEAFRKRYLKHIGKQPQDVSSGAQISATVGADTAVNPGNSEIVRPIVRLGPGVREPVENLINAAKLATVSIKGQHWGDGSVEVLLTVACHRWRDMTVLRGIVQLIPGQGKMTAKSYAELRAPPTKAAFAFGQKVEVAIEVGGTENDPHLTIAGVDGPIGKVTFGERLPEFEGLSPGDTIMVRFGTWLPDVGVIDQQESLAPPLNVSSASDGPEHIDQDGKFITQQLSDHKRRAIALLYQSTLLTPGPDGYVELSENMLLVGRGI
jgi:hypothetical protein